MRRRQFLQTSFGVASATLCTRYARAEASAPAPTAVEAVTLEGGIRTLPGTLLEDLRGALHGALLLPRDSGYDDARRLVSRRFDRHPAFIVQATGAADVSVAVGFARENGLLLAVKGGGHNEFGVSASEGAMMLDLTPLRWVRFDSQDRRLWVGGATLVGLIDYEAGARGWAVPLGGASTVGIGGQATGGGFGKLARRFGLTLDAIRAVDMVSADGQIRRASERENPDLFWAVRGGGGNFGVATAIELELHPIPERVLAGSLVFPFGQARQVLAAYGDYTAAAPDDLYVELALGVRADPEACQLQLNVCYSGAPADAEQVLKPMYSFGKVLRDQVKAMSYPAAQGANAHSAARAVPDGSATDAYARAGFLEGFDASLAALIAESLMPSAGRHVNMLFQQGGGAISRSPNSATAFSHRSISHDMLFVASWNRDESAPSHAAFAHQTWARLVPFTRGFYVNDLAGAVTAPEVAANYGSNAARLAAVKAKYDPKNLFRLNANILPGAVSSRAGGSRSGDQDDA
jgi:FAD/FMN-containing dehydrogenase